MLRINQLMIEKLALLDLGQLERQLRKCSRDLLLKLFHLLKVVEITQLQSQI